MSRVITLPQITSLSAAQTESANVFFQDPPAADGRNGRGITLKWTGSGNTLPAAPAYGGFFLGEAQNPENNGVYTLGEVVTDTDEWKVTKHPQSGVPPVERLTDDGIEVTPWWGLAYLGVQGMEIHVVDFVGTFSLQPQISVDGATWNDLGSPVTHASGIVALTGFIPFIRLNVTAIGTSIDLAYAI